MTDDDPTFVAMTIPPRHRAHLGRCLRNHEARSVARGGHHHADVLIAGIGSQLMMLRSAREQPQEASGGSSCKNPQLELIQHDTMLPLS